MTKATTATGLPSAEEQVLHSLLHVVQDDLIYRAQTSPRAQAQRYLREAQDSEGWPVRMNRSDPLNGQERIQFFHWLQALAGVTGRFSCDDVNMAKLAPDEELRHRLMYEYDVWSNHPHPYQAGSPESLWRFGSRMSLLLSFFAFRLVPVLACFLQ